MADQQPAPTSLPPVKLEDFLADRAQFADSIWRATTIATGSIIVLLVLMAIFLV